MGRLLQRVAEDKLRWALIKMSKAAIMPQSAPPLGAVRSLEVLAPP